MIATTLSWLRDVVSLVGTMVFFPGLFILVTTGVVFPIHVPKHLSRLGMLMAALPSVLMLLLCYSLAIHMHQSLGDWPSSIGQRGFPPELVTHSDLAEKYFMLLLYLSALAWPVAVLACLVVRRWRRFVPYFAIHASSYIVAWGLLLLAPARFLQ